MKHTGNHHRKHFTLFGPPSPGFSFHVFDKLMWRNYVHPKYYLKALGGYLLNIINAPFRLYEKRILNPVLEKEKIEYPPVFIIGHWRSGTTYLHNLITTNPLMAYVTTYQSVFPDTMVNKAGRWLFSRFMRIFLPSDRIVDKVRMSPEYPEEEEFTLGMKVPLSYYFFWLFPQRTREYYNRYIEFCDISDQLIADWEREYSLLIKKAIKNTNGKIFVSKNPPNTGRIPRLLKLFPDAKFIFIHRNPLEVYSSTLHFLKQLLPKLEYHSIPDQEIEENMIYIYKSLLSKYLIDRDLIPSRSLIEIRYDELVTDPIKELRRIYQHFGFPGEETALQRALHYIGRIKDFSGNKLDLTPAQYQRALREFDFAFRAWNYPVGAGERVAMI